jgi:hypothetical protein
VTGACRRALNQTGVACVTQEGAFQAPRAARLRGSIEAWRARLNLFLAVL